MEAQDDKEDTITITLEEYKELIESSVELDRLYANGVDNWEGFHA